MLSVCIITYNEERFIASCLASVKAIADEIIVVDAFSTDATKAICETAGCKVYQFVWEHDFALARNRAIEKARGEWILFLDADEELQNPGILLRKVKSVIPVSVGGFILERTDVYRNKDSGKIYRHPIGIVRLFRNHPQVRYTSPIHEEINTSIYAAGLKLNVLTGCVLKHKVSELSDQQLEAKQGKYLSMLNRELEKDPSNAWILYHKAKTLWFFNDNQAAFSLFMEVAQRSDVPPDLRVSSYCNAALLTDDETQALKHTAHAENIISNTFIARFVQADILYRANRFAAALKSYVSMPTSLQANSEGSVIPGGLYLRPEIKLHKIASCLYALDNLVSSQLLFYIACKIYPFDTINLFGLAMVNKKRKRYQVARVQLEKCLQEEPLWKFAREELQKITNE